MRKIGLYAFVCFLNLISNSSHLNSQTLLFQEHSKDWKIFGNAKWSHSEDVLKGSANASSGFVMTESSYKDFVLELEFKPDSTINSGIFIRCNNKEISAVDCHELNIWDLNPNQDYRTGAIVNKAVPLKYVETLNKWNTYKIKAEKNHIQVWVNDTLTADSEYDYPGEGFIGLQAMGTGEIKFRKLNLTRIK